MFKRVSSHLKSLATPFLSDITGTVSGLVQGNNTISGQQGKVAAQLLKKSPFEKLDSPMEAIKRDPLGFSQVQYPIDLTSTDLGHYILFYTLQNKFTQGGRNGISDIDMAARVGLADYDSNADFSSKTLKTLRQGNTPAPKLDNSVLSKFPSHQTVTSAIALYMPPNVKVSYKNNYEAEATELSGDVAKAIGGLKTATSRAEQIDAVMTGVTAGLGQY